MALNGARADVRTKETNLGNLLADAMLEKMRPAGAQVAIMNGGGVRTSIDAGPITLGEVLEVQPFGNILTLVTITGAQLKEALENGVSQVEAVAGRFPQVAGMRYTWNPAAAVGSRIVSVEVGGAALDPAASYRLVTLNFLVTGGDGFSVLQSGTDKYDTGFLDSDVTAAYIAAHSPVSPAVEGRIVQSATAAPAPHRHQRLRRACPQSCPGPAAMSLRCGCWRRCGAGAIGSGMRLRNRVRRAVEGEPVAATAVEQEEEAEVVA